MNHARIRRILVTVWLAVMSAALYLFFGSIRGFTLIPATTLVVAAVPFFPPVRLFALTLLGILISSASIYLFSEALHLDEIFARRHQRRIDDLKAVLQKYELPVIIGWSFFPLAPTDLICYVCGVLKIDFRKCLLGVGIGEGVICAIYIFLGDYALRALRLRP
jgi:uncharacterized membrane protein YdjX (TVP38/TMEM64 family)